eukprot:2286170-Rhodomonas_salina.1
MHKSLGLMQRPGMGASNWHEASECRMRLATHLTSGLFGFLLAAEAEDLRHHKRAGGDWNDRKEIAKPCVMEGLTCALTHRGGCSDASQKDKSDLAALRKKADSLEEEIEHLDSCIADLNKDLLKQQVSSLGIHNSSSMRSSPTTTSFGYTPPCPPKRAQTMPDTDRACSCHQIREFRDQTLIAIKAPSGTTLAVPYSHERGPNGDSEPRYQIGLKVPSRSGHSFWFSLWGRVLTALALAPLQIFLKSQSGPVSFFKVSTPGGVEDEEMEDGDGYDMHRAVREVHGTSTRCLGLMRRGVGAAGMGAEEAGMMPGIEGDAMAEEEDAELKGGGARLEAEAEGLEEIEGLAGFSDFYAC